VLVPVWEGRGFQTFQEFPSLVEDMDEVHLGGETYLTLLRLNLENKQEILEFVNSYGLLGGDHAYRDVENEWYRDKLFPGLEDERKINAIRHHFPIPPAFQDGVVPVFLVPYTETFAEFRFATGLLRDAAQAWRVLREGCDPSAFKWFTDDREDAPIKTPYGALLLLKYVLPRLLGHFGPNIEHTIEPSPEQLGLIELFGAELGRPEVTHTRGPRRAPLYQSCALELYNHITEDARYRTCANETCERLFVRQSGRAEHGQYRTAGVRYCSDGCARAQAQRQYRRRKASKR
jgi:hypothetical protein